jgi:hypothetical protein
MHERFRAGEIVDPYPLEFKVTFVGSTERCPPDASESVDPTVVIPSSSAGYNAPSA